MPSYHLLLAAVLLLATTTAALADSPPFPCTYTTADGTFQYDLSNMWRNPAAGQQDYVGRSSSDGSTFYINICAEAAAVYCTPANGVCQVPYQMPSTGYGDGYAALAMWSDYRMLEIGDYLHCRLVVLTVCVCVCTLHKLAMPLEVSESCIPMAVVVVASVFRDKVRCILNAIRVSRAMGL
jgi:hypothetical protein